MIRSNHTFEKDSKYRALYSEIFQMISSRGKIIGRLTNAKCNK